VSCGKTAEPIEMPSGTWTRVGARKHYLVRVQIPTRCGGNFEGEKQPVQYMPGHVRGGPYTQSDLAGNSTGKADADWDEVY